PVWPLPGRAVRDGCRCTDGCDKSCSLGKVCTAESKCVPGCTSDDDCGSGEACSKNKCRTLCEGFSDCSEGFTCRSDREGNSVCQHCTGDNQCPPDHFCKTEDTGRGDAQMDPNVGLCVDSPPDCLKDGYGDNHAEPDAHVIEELPFEPSQDKRPLYCNSPTTNPEYSNDGHDWWKFSASTGKVIDVTIKYNKDAGNLDLALKNSTGKTLVTSERPPGTDPGTENGKERIVYGVDAGSDFLLQVRGTLAKVPNLEYDLNVDVRDPKMCGSDGYEDNDEVGNPASLPAGQPEMGLNVCGDDKDFYELDAKANQLVNVVVQGAPKRLGDLDLVLYDSDGQVIKQVRESSGGKHQLTFSTEEAAKYIVEVRVVSGVGYVDYDLEWDQRDNKCADRYEVNDNCPTEAPKLTRSNYVGQTKTIDNLAVCTDKDFYAQGHGSLQCQQGPGGAPAEPLWPQQLHDQQLPAPGMQPLPDPQRRRHRTERRLQRSGDQGRHLLRGHAAFPGTRPHSPRDRYQHRGDPV
ncbi:MAG: PPC domain-containing protein, partial [Bradymonadaceae bacterium]